MEIRKKNRGKIFKYVYIIVIKDNKILLQEKHIKTYLKYYSLCGERINKGGDIKQIAKQCLYDQAKIIANNLEKKAIINIRYLSNMNLVKIYLFFCQDFSRNIRSNLSFKYFCLNKIPIDKIWYGDMCWFPFIKNKNKFKAYILYDEIFNLKRISVSEVKTL